MEQRSRRRAVEGGRVGGHPGRQPTAGHARAALCPGTAAARADTRSSSATRCQRGAARASRGEATALGSGRTAPRREREGEGEMKEGKLGAEAVEVAFHDREERRRARERKRRRDIFRRIQKEKQKLLFIFGRPDSDQT